MRLRTQPVLAAFLLAIVPLTAIVLYSYSSSRDALESAYRHEAARLTKQMDSRLASIRTDLETRLADVSSLPLQKLPDDTKSATQQPVVHSSVVFVSDASRTFLSIAGARAASALNVKVTSLSALPSFTVIF